jgi:transaldolase
MFAGLQRWKKWRKIGTINNIEFVLKKEEIPMKKNQLIELESLGQSVWLDYIRRDLITSGELGKLIDEDGLSGITSNPAIFEKAISGSHDYDKEIEEMIKEGKDTKSIYEAISIKDVMMAADEFRSLYDKTDGRDGFVSLEVNPHLAHETDATIEEARRLWKALNRPNVFIKVPATFEGLPAIQQLISEGININITLLFGLPRYREVAYAYIKGIEKRASMNEPLEHVASVASFFISRISTLVDPLEEILLARASEQEYFTTYVMGNIAISSAKFAYEVYKEIFNSERFSKLAEKGARPQRLLWASTSTKNPKYSDIKYVEALIGKDTINTLPPETLNAYRDHGDPKLRLDQDVQQARLQMDELPDMGIEIDKITQQLEDEGVDKFNQQYDKIMSMLETARKNQ